MRSNPTRTGQSVSSTTLNLLRDCPRCFWLHMRRGLSRPRQPWPSLLGAVNTIIEDGWDLYHRNKMLPPAVRGLIHGTPVRPRLEGWYDKDSSLCLVGRLDACVRTDIGFFAPIDHKTKGTEPSFVEDGYLLQLDMYALLLEKNGYPSAGVGYLDFYIPSGRLDSGLSLKVVVLEAETKTERAKEWLLQARSVLDQSEPPKRTADCEYCECVAAKRQAGGEI